ITEQVVTQVANEISFHIKTRIFLFRDGIGGIEELVQTGHPLRRNVTQHLFQGDPCFLAINAPALKLYRIRWNKCRRSEFLPLAAEKLEDPPAADFGHTDENLEQRAFIGGFQIETN